MGSQIESKLQWAFWQLSVLPGQLVDISQCLYSVGNMKPRVWWNNEVKSSEQSFCFCFAKSNIMWLSCFHNIGWKWRSLPRDRCAVCKHIRVGSTYLYKRSPYTLYIASNPTNTCQPSTREVNQTNDWLISDSMLMLSIFKLTNWFLRGVQRSYHDHWWFQHVRLYSGNTWLCVHWQWNTLEWCH